MKVEIELAYIESLRNELSQQKIENEKLKEKIKEMDINDLKERAVYLAYKLLDNYMNAVFRSLGFDNEFDRSCVKIDTDLLTFVGPEWYKYPRINVILGADCNNKFKEAYMRIGIQNRVKTVKKNSSIRDLKL